MTGPSSTPKSGSRNSSPAIRGLGRGRIQKRRAGPSPVDKDGDLVMNSALPQEGSNVSTESSRGRNPVRGKPGPRHAAAGRNSRSVLSTQQAQKSIARGLESDQFRAVEQSMGASNRPGRQRGNTKLRRAPQEHASPSLRIHGLKESKVASNPDGGVRALLDFLERKVNSSDAKRGRVRVLKVCSINSTASSLEGFHSRPTKSALSKHAFNPASILTGYAFRMSRASNFMYTANRAQSFLDGDDLVVTVNADHVAEFLNLDKAKFAGAILSVNSEDSLASVKTEVAEGALSDEAKKTEQRIKEILSTRYNVDLKLLNLSGLGKDPGLAQMGMFDAERRITKLFPVLMVVCDRLFKSAQEKREAIVSVTLAENELDTIANVTSLAQTFPDLQNLDLSKNKFKDLRGLEGWRWKFRGLQNLKLSDNPIEASSPNYTQEVAKWFPTLQILNDLQIRTPAEASATPSKEASDSSCPIPLLGPDFRDVGQVGETFLRQFFTLYDRDRVALADQFYDEESTHSVSVNVSAPRDDSSALSSPFDSTTFKQSRNLVKLKDRLPAQVARLLRGASAVKKLWLELPASKHPDLVTDTSKYMIDCRPVYGLRDPTGAASRGVDGLMLMVHGEFEEVQPQQPSAVPRSFSRTFVLGPGRPSGPPIRVVSDLLVVKAWGRLPLPVVVSEQSPAVTVSEEEAKKEELVKQLVLTTQMTAQYAALCLAETGWDLQQALQAFEANKVCVVHAQSALPCADLAFVQSKLPADAFIS
jgi:nuclear RNA export factor